MTESFHNGMNGIVQWQLIGAIRYPQQRQTRLRSLWTFLFSVAGKSWHMIHIHCQSSPSTTTNAMLSASSQTLPVITIDDYERDVFCQFTHFGSANNANLSCSSKDSNVGKPELSVKTKYGSLQCQYTAV